MSDLLPPDLPRLQVLAVYLEMQLAAVRAAIADAEKRAAEEAARPSWWVQWGRRTPDQPPHGVLHKRGCWCPGEASLHAADVRVLLEAHGDRILMCQACRPQERRLRRVVSHLAGGDGDQPARAPRLRLKTAWPGLRFTVGVGEVLG